MRTEEKNTALTKKKMPEKLFEVLSGPEIEALFEAVRDIRNRLVLKVGYLI